MRYKLPRKVLASLSAEDMAQWRKIQSLANSRAEVYTRLNMMYNNQDRKGLLDIRQWCSEWIEKIDWYAAFVVCFML